MFPYIRAAARLRPNLHDSFPANHHAVGQFAGSLADAPRAKQAHVWPVLQFNFRQLTKVWFKWPITNVGQDVVAGRDVLRSDAPLYLKLLAGHLDGGWFHALQGP